MELKTIKEFAHKNNLGEGLEYSNDKFRINLNNSLEITYINNLLNNIKQTLNTVYKVKGSTTVANINSMTIGNAMIGYVYNLLDSGVITNGIEGELDVVKGGNVVYTEEGWDEFAASLDLNQCAGDNISIENNIINALGYTSTDWDSFATGIRTTASGAGSHSEGDDTHATGQASHTEGGHTIANNSHEHAQGKYNKSNTGETEDTKTIHSIGIGTTNANRKNAQEVMQNGDHYIVGVGGYDGTNPYEAYTLLEVINSKVEKEEGKYLSSNDYTNSDKEKVVLIESLQTIILELQEKVNSKEYSIDFESDSTTAQEINLMDSMSLKKLVGYNITGVNLQIGTGSAINLVLTDNVWEGDPIVINQGERVYWDIIKYDESAPAVLGIYETKIL